MRDLSGVGRPVDRCAFSVLHQIVWITDSTITAKAKVMSIDCISVTPKRMNTQWSATP